MGSLVPCSELGDESFDFDGYEGGRVYPQRQIAEGGYSYIFRARDAKGKTLCLKKIPAQNSEQLKAALAEVKMFQLMKGKPGFLQLLGSRTMSLRGGDSKEVVLLFPLLKDSLFSVVARAVEAGSNSNGDAPVMFSEQQALVLTGKVCEALQALHEAGFIHGDLKPENILLDKNNEPHLCDLGSCRPVLRTAETRNEALRIQDDAEKYCTAAYRAPELHDVKTGSSVDGKIDVFGLGCVLYFMLVGKNPFDGGPVDGFMKLALMQGAVEYPKPSEVASEIKISSTTRKLIKAMLRANPKKRLTIQATASRCTKALSSLPAAAETRHQQEVKAESGVKT
eukprot:jgi/Bigna1/77640/fgenesh1_pg.49_\